MASVGAEARGHPYRCVRSRIGEAAPKLFMAARSRITPISHMQGAPWHACVGPWDAAPHVMSAHGAPPGELRRSSE